MSFSLKSMFKKKPINVQEASNINPKNVKTFFIKSLGGTVSSDRSQFIAPTVDLEEIKNAALADSYIKAAFQKYSYLVMKPGYKISGENKAAVDYINQRLRIMSFATRIPFDILIQQIADDLNKYSNAFLFKSRVDKIMDGVNAAGVFHQKPVGGYFRADPTTIEISVDPSGTVLKYKQKTPEGEERVFNAEDIIHFYIDKDASEAFGTPRVYAALEDVKLLRKVEGIVMSLIYRFAIPIYHFKVGSDKDPAMGASQGEIEEIKAEVGNMDMDGCLITNERTAVTSIGAEGEALDATGYLNYFEKRVFSALSVSDSQMGRGGAKKDADSMEAQAHDLVKHIQRTLSVFIENYMFNELLLEGGFDPILVEDDIVRFIFNEISLETKVKLENHEMLKYQSNVVTLEEVRTKLGYLEDADETGLYAFKIETEKANRINDNESDNAMELQKASISALPASQAKGKPEKETNEVSSKNMPQNQHGKTSVSIKESVDESIKAVKREQKNANEEFMKLKKQFVDEYFDDKDVLKDMARESIKHSILTSVYSSVDKGSERFIKEYKEIHGDVVIERASFASDEHMSEIKRDINASIDGLFKDLNRKLKKAETNEEIAKSFDSLLYRIQFCLDHYHTKAYWNGYLQTASYFGCTSASIAFNSEEERKKHKKAIDIGNYSIDQIPAFHPNCKCKINAKIRRKDG